MTGPLLGHLKNGAPVYDRPQSHIHTEYDKVFEYIEKVLPLVAPSSEVVFYYSHDFGDVIGESVLVPTVESDEIVYAQRPRRAGLTRFVKNKPLRPNSVFTVVLKRDQFVSVDQYILVTAYVGEHAPPEPWDKAAMSGSVAYWNKNALVWGSLPVIAGTETSECPW